MAEDEPPDAPPDAPPEAPPEAPPDAVEAPAPRPVHAGLAKEGHTVASTLTSAAQSVLAFHAVELRQQETQKNVVHDLMRCVAENHECILRQSQQLEENQREIAELKEMLAGQQLAERAERDDRLGSLEAQLADLLSARSTAAEKEEEQEGGRDGLDAMRKQLSAVNEQANKTSEELGRVWGYIMVDDAAEDVVEGAFRSGGGGGGGGGGQTAQPPGAAGSGTADDPSAPAPAGDAEAEDAQFQALLQQTRKISVRSGRPPPHPTCALPAHNPGGR
jgi:hypothetical protein